MAALPCPTCNRPINASFTTCPFCAARISRNTERPLSRNHAALAQRTCELLRPEWAFDVSIASALLIDTFLAAEYGVAANGPPEGPWPADPRELQMLASLGSLFGEIVRKTFGGEWTEEVGAQNPLDAAVKLPDGTVIMAAAKPYKRARFGSEDSVWGMFQQLRSRFRAIPDPREIQGFFRVATHLESRGMPAQAYMFVQEVARRELPPGLRAEAQVFERRLVPKLREDLARVAAQVAKARPATAPQTPADDFNRLGGDSLFEKAGIRTAYVPSSLNALDLWFEVTFGSDPVAEAVREAPENVRLERIIAGWLGEYFVHALGGKWEPAENTRLAHVVWPGGFRTCPAVYFSKRLANGGAHTIDRQVGALVQTLLQQGLLAKPPVDDPEEWWKQAAYALERHRSPTLAVMFGRLALRRRPGHVPWLAQVARWCDEAARKGSQEPSLDPVDAWQQVLEVDPSQVGAITGLAAALLLKGDHAEAAALSARALALDPAAADAWCVRGRALAELGHDDEAIQALDRSISIAPQQSEARLALASLLLARDRPAEARETLLAIRRLGSMPPLGTELQALACERLKKVREAYELWKGLAADRNATETQKVRAAQRRDALEKTLELRLEQALSGGDTQAMTDATLAVTRDFPHAEQAFRELGVGYAILGRFDESLAAFDRALAIDPRQPATWDHKAVTLGRMKRFADAVATLDEGLSVLPNAPALLTRRGVMLALGGDVAAAVPSLQKAIAAGDEGDAALFLSDAEHRLGRTEDAKQTLRSWLALAHKASPRKVASARRVLYQLETGRNPDPGNAERWLDRGLELANQGRIDEALVAYDESLALDPTRGDSWHNRGAALAQLGRDQEAIEAYIEAEKLGAGAISQVARAGALARTGRVDQALTLLDTVLERSPEDTSAMTLRARLRTYTGQLDSALADYDRYLTHRPTDVAILEAKATVLDKLQRPAEARLIRERLAPGDRR